MSDRYTLIFRLIHWITAGIILVMLIAGQRFGTELPDAERAFSLMGHSSLGVLVVAFLLVRLTMRLSGMAGRPTHDIASWQSFASRAVQAGIYLLMIYLPITGFLTARAHSLPVKPFGMVSISSTNQAAFEAIRPWHEIGTKALIFLLALHIGAALMHRFVYRDGVMRSMSLFRQRR